MIDISKLDFTGIETNIEKRWDQGMDHHPDSEQLMRALMEIDDKYNNSSQDLQVGGDGDNGEQLMFLLDVLLEARDNAFWK